ncbi:MAG: nucleotidyltransferase substrate binding protein [Elusimicrobiaceae bacterium]
MKLDLSSLQKAVDSLARSLLVADRLIKGQNKDEDEVIRAGVIQNFEFTYERCWKFMQLWLEHNYSPDISGTSRRDLFRTACEYKLIDDFEAWLKYHAARNKTSNTYDCAEAENIYKIAAEFSKDATKFLKALEQKNV